MSNQQLYEAETPKWVSTKYLHWESGFLIDGDYHLVKTNKITGEVTEERVWNDIIPPFPAPVGPVGYVPTLVNTDNPFYIWVKKPAKYHPCWFVQSETGLTILDMLTEEVIGRGIPIPSPTALAISGQSHIEEGELIDGWPRARERANDAFNSMGIPCTMFSMPYVADIMPELRECNYWYSYAHGDQNKIILRTTHFSYDPPDSWDLYAADVAEALSDRAPYILAIVDSCYALNSVREGTWAYEFTKNTVGHFVVGSHNVNIYPYEYGCFYSGWEERFFQYLIDGETIPDSFESSAADYPEVAPIIGMYEGTDLTLGLNELHTATAKFAVSPAGLDCVAELWLGSNGSKVATSGNIPFTSTGAEQSLSFPITMPAEGTYQVYLDIYIGEFLFEYQQKSRSMLIPTQLPYEGKTSITIV